jgi:hypothetical protein
MIKQVITKYTIFAQKLNKTSCKKECLKVKSVSLLWTKVVIIKDVGPGFTKLMVNQTSFAGLSKISLLELKNSEFGIFLKK